jgi:dTDP-4-amino-4,6-dideoxygalactose transaminase
MINHSASHVLAADFDYVRGIVERNHVGPGALCEALRQQLASRLERPSVTLADSGAAALHLCLAALAAKEPRKSRVLVGAYVCPEVISAVMRASLVPVFVDCRTDSMNVDMAAMAGKLDANTLAVICTGIGGTPDDITATADWNVAVISDCAQAVGARLGGRDVASSGTCTILSFGPTKMLSAGAGGAFLGDEQLGREVAALARTELTVEEYKRSGFRPTYGQHMSDLTAGLAGAQLQRLDAMVARRREIAAAYDVALQGHADVTLVPKADLVKSNRFRYYFFSESAGAWVAHLRTRDIDARRSIAHVIPEYQGDSSAYPNLLRLAPRLVSVPIFPAMTVAQADFVAEMLDLGPKSKL